MSNLNFDPGGVGVHNGNYFGFPWPPDLSDIIILNIPWDATTSYRRGTANGPLAMLNASTQLDFYSFDNPGAPLVRCGTDRSLHEAIVALNQQASPLSSKVIEALEQGVPGTDPKIQTIARSVNTLSKQVEQLVFDRSTYWLKQGKKLIVAGGEHSVPLGFLKALTGIHEHFGILQIDAHADLREHYEGFQQSHASIMFNALAIVNIRQIVQVGIRDVSHAEMELAEAHPKVTVFSDYDLQHRQFCGTTWFEQCRDIVKCLPEKVYLSLDIDGLSPLYCPNTGTPVPGGLTPDAVMYLTKLIAESGREIIGADLCEVAPGADEWDASVGARMLYRMAVLMAHTTYPTTA
jgi:agmatinase